MMRSLFLTPSGQGRKEGGIVSITPSKPRIEPMARSEWPLWARIAVKFRKPGETGIGDTIHRMIPKADAFKKWFDRKFGQSCGCTERQRWLNARVPYRDEPESSPPAA